MPPQLLKQIETNRKEINKLKRDESAIDSETLKNEILQLQEQRIAEIESNLSDLTQTVIQFITIIESAGVVELPDGLLTDSTG